MDNISRKKIFMKNNKIKVLVILLAVTSFWYTYKAGKSAGNTITIVEIQKIPVNILGQGFCISCKERYNWDQLHKIVDEFNKPYKTEQGEF